MNLKKFSLRFWPLSVRLDLEKDIESLKAARDELKKEVEELNKEIEDLEQGS